jgi:hypothetical protein
MKDTTDAKLRDALTNWYMDYIDYLIDNYEVSFLYGELNAQDKIGPDITIRDENKMAEAAVARAGAYGQLLRDEGATIINGEPVPWLKEFDVEQRKKISEIIETGVSNNEQVSEIKDKLNVYFDQRTNHAEVVARTEVARITNEGALSWFGEKGVQWVLVHDNEGPNSCEECGIANGQIWSVEYAQSRLLQHPNCIRGFTPTERGGQK